MYKIYYDQEFYDDMENFSNYLRDYYLKLYTDTGIIDESIILNSYDQSINLLQKQIFDDIERFCKTWLLWRMVLNDINDEENWHFYISINSYQVKIDYLLNKNLAEVLIKNVKTKT